MKKAIISTRQESKYGTGGYRITGFKNILSFDELPKEYLSSPPHFYLFTNSILYYQSFSASFVLCVDDWYQTDAWEHLICLFKIAGERLMDINKKGSWNKEQEWEI